MSRLCARKETMREYFNKSETIMCPYWLTQSRRSIRCESPLNGSSYIESRYNSDGERGNQTALFCECKNWHECPIAKSNDAKWENYYKTEAVKEVTTNAGRRF